MEVVNRKRYFISLHGRQAGPLTKEELGAMNITAATLVWNEEVFDWQRADSFEELKDVLYTPAPVVHRGPLHWLRIGRKKRQ